MYQTECCTVEDEPAGNKAGRSVLSSTSGNVDKRFHKPMLCDDSRLLSDSLMILDESQ